MSNSIRLRKGLKADLPSFLSNGEPGWCTDAFELYIGTGAANKLVGEASFLKLTGGVLTGALTLNDDPTDALHSATKQYVDSVASGLDLKTSVRLATTAALPACTSSGSGVGKTLTADAVGVLTIDSVATVLNDRILVQDQAAGEDNGIYKVTTEGTSGVEFVLTRATDADTDAEVTGGMYCFVEEGAVNADAGFVLITNNPITIDTTALVFSQFSSKADIVAGDGLTKTGSTIDAVGTADRIIVNADSLDIASTYIGQSSITTLGTITTGIWSGDVIAADKGGTGIANNAASTLTISGNYGTTLTVTNTTDVTLPVNGTLLSDNSTINGGSFT